MARFTYALVEFNEKRPHIPQTWRVESRHETLETAMRAFDRKHDATDAPRYRLLGLNRHGQPDGNGFMSIAAARACI